MNIGVPRVLIVALAAGFSAYQLVLAAYAIGLASNPVPYAAAMGIFAIATAVSLAPWGPRRMPQWMGVLNLTAVIAMALLVGAVIDYSTEGGPGYASWYVAAAGALLTITATRGRPLWAWIGIGFLFVHSVVVLGFGGLTDVGIVGSILWVAVAHVLSTALAKATKDAQRFAAAEREATDWQAAQEAHVYERQFRLGQTSAMALTMLRTIQDAGGELTPEQRQECLHLEGAIRDEIRGRRLLNDAVREEVMDARRRGVTVTLLDEGGLDEMNDEELERVLNRLALAIHESGAEKIIARTVPEPSDIAVTVVGLRTVEDEMAIALGQDSDEDDVELWLEIPRKPVTA